MPSLDKLISRVRIDQTLNSTTVISDADLTTLLNEGALDLAKRSLAFPQLSGTWNAVANQQVYVLSGGTPQVTNFLDVFWDAGGLIYKPTASVTQTAPNNFTFVSEAWLNLNNPGWQAFAASDTLLYVYLTYDASGNVALGVVPKSATTTPTFKLVYLSRGTDMTGTNYPWTNSTVNLTHTEPYHKAIAFYAMWQCHDTITHMDALAKKYEALYVAVAAEFAASQRRLFVADVSAQILADEVIANQQFGSN